MAGATYKRVKAIVLFADLVGSSEVANSLSPEDYWIRYVSNFHAAVSIAQEKARLDRPTCRFELTGDECAIFSPWRNDKSLAVRVHEIFRFTYILKATWFISPFNITRMSDHKTPREIAVGAHCGTLMKFNTPKLQSRYKDGPWYLGHTTNVAKRIESISRERQHLNMCISAPIGNVITARSDWNRGKRRGSGRNEIIYGLLEVDDPEYRRMKGIEPTVRVNEILPSWEIARNRGTNRYDSAKRLIEAFANEDEAMSVHIEEGKKLIVDYYERAKRLSGDGEADVRKAVEPLIEFAQTYAHDSWSMMLAGLSLLSLAKIRGISGQPLADRAKKTGKHLMKRLLKKMSQQEGQLSSKEQVYSAPGFQRLGDVE